MSSIIFIIAIRVLCFFLGLTVSISTIAQLRLSEMLVETDRDFVTYEIGMSNQGKIPMFVEVSVAEILNPGLEGETSIAILDDDNPLNDSVVIMPRKSILYPGQKQQLRLLSNISLQEIEQEIKDITQILDSNKIQNTKQKERAKLTKTLEELLSYKDIREKQLLNDTVYIITVNPKTSKPKNMALDENTTEVQTHVRLEVAYGIRFIVRPENPQYKLAYTLDSKKLQLINQGNTNIQIDKIVSCKEKCVDVMSSSARLYAGNAKEFNIDASTNITIHYRLYNPKTTIKDKLTSVIDKLSQQPKVIVLKSLVQ